MPKGSLDGRPRGLGAKSLLGPRDEIRVQLYCRPAHHACILAEEYVHLDGPPSDLAAARGDDLEACWYLAIQHGMRQGELIGLRWGHVDLDNAALQVVGPSAPSAKQGAVEFVYRLR